MKTLKKHIYRLVSAVLTLVMFVQMTNLALAFTLTSPEWDFIRLSVANTNETLAEEGGVYRAYNPNIERGVLSFTLEKTQPASIEVYELASDPDPRGDFVGYLQGNIDGTEYTFDDAEEYYFKGYDGLIQERVDALEPDPYLVTNGTNFINVVEWDGVVIDDAPVSLMNNTEYVIVIQPIPLDSGVSVAPLLYLPVTLDGGLPPQGQGSAYSNAAPFAQLSSLPGTHSVNVITGNYLYSNIDLAIAGPDPLAFSRTYNSTDGWRTGFDYSLEVSELYARVNMPDGVQYDFALQYDGTYAAPEGNNSQLEAVGGGYEFTNSTKTVYAFDATGQITKITTLGGFVTTFTYGGGKLTSVTGRSGTLTLDYTGDNVTSVTASPSNRSVSYTYDGNGNLASFTNPEGKTFRYGYDGDHNMTSFTDGNGRLCLELEYDAYSRVTELYINGVTTANTLAYDLQNRETTAVDSTGRQFVYSYDRDGHVVSIAKDSGAQTYSYADGRTASETDADGNTTSYEYDANGNLSKITSPDGSGSIITYNNLNLPVKTERFDTAQAVVAASEYTYDERGNVRSQTDANGKTTTYTYDGDNNCLTSTDSNNKTTTFTYDTEGRLTGATTPDGETTILSYNADGKLDSEKTALGFKTEYFYDGNGYMTSKKDPLGNVTSYVVDGNGRTIKQTDPLGGITEWEYDSTGNVEKMTDPLLRVTEYTYDSAGRQLTSTSPFGVGETGEVSYGYDADGRVTGMTDARGSTWSYGYDSRGYQTSLTDPYGNSLDGEYDSNGRMTKSTDARGGITKFKYDTNGNVTLATDPMGGEREYAYDNKGNMTSATDENDHKWEYKYDGKDNLLEAKDPDGGITEYEYDNLGRLVKTTSPEGNTRAFTYDADGRVTESEDGEGKVTEYTYDALARLTDVKYADNTTIHYVYDALGRMTQFTDTTGQTAYYTYDLAGQLTVYENALGAQTKYEYYHDGNLKSTENALGGVTSYVYDKNGNLLSATDALDQTVSYTYDNLNRPITAKDARGGIAEYEYDANGNLVKVTNPDGGVIEYTYDKNDRLTETKQGDSTTLLEYDPAGNITKLTDPMSNNTRLFYDSLNRNTKVELPDGGETSYTYDADGRVKTVTRKISDGESAVTEYTYDKNGRVTKIEDALGNSRTVKYDDVGQVIEETDENNNVYRYAYNAGGQLTQYTDPMGNISAYTYDALGRLKSETAPHAPSAAANTTSYDYDVLGRVTQLTDPMNRKTTLTYDALGQIKTVTDAKGGVTAYEYDANGNIISTEDALHTVSTFEYDSMNRLIAAHTPNGQATLYTYDTRGLVTRVVDPSRGTSFAVYDKNGNLISETDANGNVTEYAYDGVSRVKSIAYDDGQTVSYAYNLAGQLTELTDRTGTTEFTSDPLGQLLTVTDPQGLVTVYEWDNAGNRKSVKAPDNAAVTYEYNGNSRMTKAITSDGVTAYEYFDSTLLKSVALPNGESTDYTYNSNGKRVSEEHRLNGTVRRTYGYTYDELGRLISETHANVGVALEPLPTETYTYQYDALDRLTYFKGSNGEATSYTYDAAGNLTREVSSLAGATDYTYNGNRLTAKTAADGNYAYTYDAAGNLISETKDGALNKTLGYDATGRFVLGENADGETSEYVYNGLGYRVENTTTRKNPNYLYQNSTGSDGAEYPAAGGEWTYFDETGLVKQSETAVTTKTYTPDFTTGGLRDIMVTEKGMFSQTYSYGLGLISVNTAAETGSEASVQQILATEYNAHYFAHQNRLGGESHYTDAAGKLLSYNEFDAWGDYYTAVPEDVNANGLNNGLGFTGYTWDGVLDLYFAQARMYDAASRRFVSADPVGGSVAKPISINPYLYCQSDPVNNIDPTGMYMPGDENLGLTADQTYAIEALSELYFATNDMAERARLHDAADAIRNGVGATPVTVPVPSYASNGFTPPPTMYSVMVQAVAASQPTLSYAEVMKTANTWTIVLSLLHTPVTAPDSNAAAKANANISTMPSGSGEDGALGFLLAGGMISYLDDYLRGIANRTITAPQAIDFNSGIPVEVQIQNWIMNGTTLKAHDKDIVMEAFYASFNYNQSYNKGLKDQNAGNTVPGVGSGTGSVGSTGRTTPNNLNEQLGMEQVQSAPLNGAKQVPIELKDTRWPATDGWVKMENVVRLSDENITVHFNYNKNTGAFADFKFK